MVGTPDSSCSSSGVISFFAVCFPRSAVLNWQARDVGDDGYLILQVANKHSAKDDEANLGVGGIRMVSEAS